MKNKLEKTSRSTSILNFFFPKKIQDKDQPFPNSESVSLVAKLSLDDRIKLLDDLVVGLKKITSTDISNLMSENQEELEQILNKIKDYIVELTSSTGRANPGDLFSLIKKIITKELKELQDIKKPQSFVLNYMLEHILKPLNSYYKYSAAIASAEVRKLCNDVIIAINEYEVYVEKNEQNVLTL